MQTMNLHEAAEFLRMHPEVLRKKARTGDLPGAKPGKCWVFLKDDLVQYVRSMYAVPRQALQVTLTKEYQTCHLSNAVVRGGLISPHRRDSALDARLAQVIKTKRRSSMIK